jgi:hypothetical protein
MNYESSQTCPNTNCPSHKGPKAIYSVYLTLAGMPEMGVWYSYICPQCKRRVAFQVGAVTCDVRIPDGAIVATVYN